MEFFPNQLVRHFLELVMLNKKSKQRIADAEQIKRILGEADKWQMTADSCT